MVNILEIGCIGGEYDDRGPAPQRSRTHVRTGVPRRPRALRRAFVRMSASAGAHG